MVPKTWASTPETWLSTSEAWVSLWKNGVLIDEDIKKMTELPPKRGSVFTQHWFYTPDCCQLAADTFLHPIHFHTSSGAMLYPPLTSLSYYKNNPLALHRGLLQTEPLGQNQSAYAEFCRQ
ncbi:hypothetical protein [Absidia glauca]|uniref:Uncharacterized protein n=1 Tax=Absidia glauca TaxID=4829 RepID=A0A168QP19_ABSGL|nr:hypothetical protein [Absidia glauca]